METILIIIVILFLLFFVSTRIWSFVLLLKINKRQGRNEINLDRMIHRMLQIEKTLKTSKGSKKVVEKNKGEPIIAKVEVPQLTKLAKIVQEVKTESIPAENTEANESTSTVFNDAVLTEKVEAEEFALNNVDDSVTLEEKSLFNEQAIVEPEPIPLMNLAPIEEQENQTAATEIKETSDRIEIEEVDENTFDSKAGRVIQKILNWIVVGEEFRNPNVSIEYAVASVWFIRIAAMMLILTVSFFLKYSIEQGFLNDKARMILSILTGVSMTFVGVKLAGKKYHIIGMGLIGGGIAALYGSIFAGFAMFNLIGVFTAFAIMIAITIAAGWISVRLNSMFVAILALIGGYATPVLINSEHTNYIGLLSYMTLLGICTLWIAKYKDWKLLNMLGVIFNYTLLILALNGKYNELDFYQVFPFLCTFFLLYSFIPIRYNIINKIHSTVVELIFMVLNTGIFYLLASLLLKDKFSSASVAGVTVALSVFYIAQIYIVLRRKLDDPPFLASLYAMATFFITYTIPLIFSNDTITSAWAIQALLFMWVSAKIRSQFMRFLSYCIYVLTFSRLISIDLVHHFIDVENVSYWSEMLNRFMTFGIVVIALAGAYFILKKEKSANTEALQIGHSSMVFLWLTGVGAFVYIQFEVYYFFNAFYAPFSTPALSFVWLAAIWILINVSQKSKLKSISSFTGFMIACFLIKLFFVDLASWDFSIDHLVCGDVYSLELGIMRLLDFIPAVALFGYWVFILKRPLDNNGEIKPFHLFLTLSIGILFLYSTLEFNTFLYFKAPSFRLGGVSILWSLFAISFILVGILKDFKYLRYVGLGLFIVVVGKVFLIDMRHLSQLYRIVALFVLSLIMLGGSITYLKYKKFFEVTNQSVYPIK